jgi:fibronectin type 3 domain-containing protein
MKILPLIALVGYMWACNTSALPHHSAQVKWHAGQVYPTSVQYRIYRSTNGTSYTVAHITPQPGLAWTDTNVLPNHKYFYYVTAYDTLTKKESPKSNIASCTVPCNAAVVQGSSE